MSPVQIWFLAKPKIKILKLLYFYFLPIGVLFLIFQKKFSNKKSFAIFTRRVEVRIYAKNKQDSVEILGEIFEVKTKKPEKVSQSLSDFSTNIFAEIFKDYNSKVSQGIRNIVFLSSLLNGFTLNPNVKSKKLLTSWYVDNFVTPVLGFIEKVVFEEKNSSIGYFPLIIFKKK